MAFRLCARIVAIIFQSQRPNPQNGRPAASSVTSRLQVNHFPLLVDLPVNRVSLLITVHAARRSQSEKYVSERLTLHIGCGVGDNGCVPIACPFFFAHTPSKSRSNPKLTRRSA